MLKTNEIISQFSTLGQKINREIELYQQNNSTELTRTILQAKQQNGWFTEENILQALQAIASNLSSEKLEKWLQPYQLPVNQPKNIGIIMAGNIPLVGFHDYLSAMVAGHRAIIKLSSNDKLLLPLLHNWLVHIAPEFKNSVVFTDKLSEIDAVIATGSNNSSRYFEAYFGKYPHIIRKNRNSVAVITGDESQEELALLGNDIFMYFGLGCRNVSKLYVPHGYNFDTFFKAIYTPFKDIIYHHKYANNYDYNKAIHLLDRVPLIENGFLLLKEDRSLHSPVAMLHYQYYNDILSVNNELKQQATNIQCIVANDKGINNAILFGKAQYPELWDYADNVDTLQFLQNL